MSNALVMMTIWRSEDESGDNWSLVHPDDRPDFIKNPTEETVEFLMAGCGAQAPGSDVWYIALHHGATPNKIEVEKSKIYLGVQSVKKDTNASH